MKDKNIKYLLWGILIVIILGFTCVVSFGQINPTIKSARLDSIRSRIPGAKIWFTDNRGGQAWLRISGDTMYLGDVTGEKKISSIGSGGINYFSEGLFLDEDTVKMGGDFYDIWLDAGSHAFVFDISSINSEFQIADGGNISFTTFNYNDSKETVVSCDSNGIMSFNAGWKDSTVYIILDTTGLHYEKNMSYKNLFNARWIPDQYYVDSYFTGSVTDGVPTETQINSITGLTPATCRIGRRISILDSDGTGLIYTIYSTGTAWKYSPGVALTQAL